MMCARSVIRSSKALHSRALGTTWVHSEKGRLVVRDHRCLFGPLGDYLKQELGTNFGQWYIADFIKRNQVITSPAPQRATQL